jgi:hypothetical protein
VRKIFQLLFYILNFLHELFLSMYRSCCWVSLNNLNVVHISYSRLTNDSCLHDDCLPEYYVVHARTSIIYEFTLFVV